MEPTELPSCASASGLGLAGPAHPAGREERGKGREERRDGLGRFGPILFFSSLFFFFLFLFSFITFDLELRIESNQF